MTAEGSPRAADGSIRHALRESLRDFYFNSWRLAPANLAWAAVLLAFAIVASMFPPALLLTGALAIPLAGVNRLAALIVRDEPATLADFAGGMRRFGGAAFAVGTGAAIAIVVLGTNVVLGFATGEPLGWFVGISALYGLAGLATYLVVLWPILVDPAREGTGLRRRLALAAVVILGRPLRSIGLAVVVVALLAVSVVLFAAILLVSVAYTSLASARVVLPTADELEARVPEGRLPG